MTQMPTPTFARDNPALAARLRAIHERLVLDTARFRLKSIGIENNEDEVQREADQLKRLLAKYA